MDEKSSFFDTRPAGGPQKRFDFSDVGVARPVHCGRAMSSARNIVAAKPYADPADTGFESTAESTTLRRPEPVPGEPWVSAFHAALRGDNATPFARVWEDLARGQLRTLRWITTDDWLYLVAQVIARPSGLSHEDAALVASVLCGEPRKAVAGTLGIPISTATGRFLRALAKLELADRNVPLPLVLAAQACAGVARIPSARAASFDFEGFPCLGVSVPRPATGQLSALTRSEQDVAQGLIEGRTRYEIAEHRRTSSYTVARQFHSIFATLRVTGRYALIRRAVELHCFHELRVLGDGS